MHQSHLKSVTVTWSLPWGNHGPWDLSGLRVRIYRANDRIFLAFSFCYSSLSAGFQSMSVCFCFLYGQPFSPTLSPHFIPSFIIYGSLSSWFLCSLSFSSILRSLSTSSPLYLLSEHLMPLAFSCRREPKGLLMNADPPGCLTINASRLALLSLESCLSAVQWEMAVTSTWHWTAQAWGAALRRIGRALGGEQVASHHDQLHCLEVLNGQGKPGTAPSWIGKPPVRFLPHTSLPVVQFLHLYLIGTGGYGGYGGIKSLWLFHNCVNSVASIKVADVALQHKGSRYSQEAGVIFTDAFLTAIMLWAQKKGFNCFASF